MNEVAEFAIAHPQAVELFKAGATLWIVLIGLSVCVGRTDVTHRIATWPFRFTLRTIRNIVGGTLIGLGTWIRGGGGNGHGNRRRH